MFAIPPHRQSDTVLQVYSQSRSSLTIQAQRFVHQPRTRPSVIRVVASLIVRHNREFNNQSYQ